MLPFDHEHGESFYNPMLPGVVEDLLAKGIAVESKGAVVIPNAKGIIPQTDGGAEEGRPAGDRPQARRGVHLHDDRPGDDQVPGGALRTRTRCCTSSTSRRRCTSRRCSPRRAAGGTTDVEFEHVTFGSVLGRGRQAVRDARGRRRSSWATLLDEAVELGLAEVRGRATPSGRRTGTTCRS